MISAVDYMARQMGPLHNTNVCVFGCVSPDGDERPKDGGPTNLDLLRANRPEHPEPVHTPLRAAIKTPPSTPSERRIPSHRHIDNAIEQFRYWKCEGHIAYAYFAYLAYFAVDCSRTIKMKSN